MKDRGREGVRERERGGEGETYCERRVKGGGGTKRVARGVTKKSDGNGTGAVLSCMSALN